MLLWLSASTFSARLRMLVSRELQKAGCRNAQFVAISNAQMARWVPRINAFKVPNPRSPGTVQCEEDRQAIQLVLRRLIAQFKSKVIVCNDLAMLRAITGEPLSLDLAHGSLYWFDGVPVIGLAPVNRLMIGGFMAFMMRKQFEKIARFCNGNSKRVPEFKFEAVRTVESAQAAIAELAACVAIGEDIETIGVQISCIGFTGIRNDGSTITKTVVFLDPNDPSGTGHCFSAEDEILIRRWIADLNDLPIVKVFQNGWYDCAYLMRDLMPPRDYFIDTMNLQHALYCEGDKQSTKSLDVLAAMHLDFYTFWKNDSKGTKDLSVKPTEEAMQKYWQYNGLDTYYTLLVAVEQLRLFQQPQFHYALANYRTTFLQAIGPCMAATFRGIACDYSRHQKIINEHKQKAEAALIALRTITGDPEFNPGSSAQVGWWIFDFFNARQTRLQKRKPKRYGQHSTDKAVVKLVKEQRNPFVNYFLHYLEQYAKAADVVSDYGCYYPEYKKKQVLTYEKSGRVIEWMNPAGTETGRMSSRKSQFWCGTNGQNMAGKLREMYRADDGYVLLDIDYKASDDRWVAYESEDPVKIDLVESGKDPHCFHASMFFERPYEELYAKYKAEDPELVDPVKGIRNITKRIGHGKNYMAGAETIYDQMGRDSAVHTAAALGIENANSLSDAALIQICQKLCDRYDHPTFGMYKRIRLWQKESALLLAKQRGLITNTFGFSRFFFGNSKDAETQRELAAFYGQGDTAGNINRALLEIFFTGVDDRKTCLFIKQVHDSFVFMIHHSVLHDKIAQIKTIMEKPTVVHGRSVRIPTDAKIGITWSKHMLDYDPQLTWEQIQEFERENFATKYPSAPLVTNLQETADNFVFSLPDDFADSVEFDQPELLDVFDDAELVEAFDL